MDNKCKNCGEICNSKFCSNSCQHDFYYKSYIQDWFNNKVDGSAKGRAVSKHIRRYLFEKHNSSCSCCGWNKINKATGKSPLDVEHIDGNSDNNRPENLTLLCPNCHSLTVTYKALNKGNGRHERRKRYSSGKSY